MSLFGSHYKEDLADGMEVELRELQAELKRKNKKIDELDLKLAEAQATIRKLRRTLADEPGVIKDPWEHGMTTPFSN
jgi:septal ring factor EnvC (AmiA/AmiB activator)